MTQANGSGSPTSKALRRYGPLAVVVVLVVGAIVLLGGGDDEDEDDTATEDTSSDQETDPDYAYPTFQEAEEAGLDIDFGDGCDTDRGRVALPLRNAAPCVAPFEDGADNGGATAPGVSEDSIKIVVYQGEPDPLQQAIVSGAGADTDPAATSQTAVDYLEMLNDVYETYGRDLDIEVFEATGGPADGTAALADARAIIDMDPFAVVGGPTQADGYWEEIAAAEILCVGTCSLAEGWDDIAAASPYAWPTGLAPEQGDVHLAELLGTQLVGEPAEFAGDESMHDQDRVFGWVQAETETGEYAERNDAFDDVFEEEHGAEIAVRSTYLYDPAAAQETATTVVARLRDAGVTTVIMSTDPIIPANITAEATKQGYFPEWVLGPSVLADTNIFGRTFDQEQWENAIGLSLTPAPSLDRISDSYVVYEWYYGTEPPTNTHGVVLPGPSRLMTGIHLAGPELTPETFERGMFERYSPLEPGKTYTRVSWGEELWGRPDYNSTDDAGVFWWDPTAEGEDETGNMGTGLKRYIAGGQRYLPGGWPEEPLPFFEPEDTMTVYESFPEEEQLPDYPPWPGSPQA
ncbi:MAG: hypothetical protein U5K30_00155 [Acidimicrobiales bacterium]|nr:hypothetical protein [Acidimicrobiales bacterium]